jgi:hypothetical protein
MLLIVVGPFSTADFITAVVTLDNSTPVGVRDSAGAGWPNGPAWTGFNVPVANAQSTDTVLIPKGHAWRWSTDDVNYTDGKSPFTNYPTTDPSGPFYGMTVTAWTARCSTIYLSTTIQLTALPTSAVTQRYALDNEVTVFINGTQVGSKIQHFSSASYWNITSSIPTSANWAVGANTIKLVAASCINGSSPFDPDGNAIDIEWTIPSSGLPTVPALAALGNDPTNPFSADPVHTRTGNYLYSHTDVAIPGRAGGVSFVRTYNSLDARSGPISGGWTHNWNARLVDNSGASPPTVDVVDWDARTDTFSVSGSTYTPPPQSFDSLTQPGGLPHSAVWLLTRHPTTPSEHSIPVAS